MLALWAHRADKLDAHVWLGELGWPWLRWSLYIPEAAWVTEEGLSEEAAGLSRQKKPEPEAAAVEGSWSESCLYRDTTSNPFPQLKMLSICVGVCIFSKFNILSSKVVGLYVCLTVLFYKY